NSVAKHFEVYGVLVTPLALTFQVRAPPAGIDGPFDALRQDLVPKDYIPTITQERGELLVHVQRRPKARFAGVQVNLILLIVTVLTILFFGGAWNWSDYSGKPILSAESIGYGAAFFSVPLLAILGCHEMGHYLVAKRYHVRASLPFFLPSIPPLGTLGAFISMRDPIPNRRALLDIGVSGPLVGFAIAIPVTLAGLALSTASAPVAATGVGEAIRPSILFSLLSLFFPLPRSFALHPLAFAGWLVGIVALVIVLVTFGPQPFVAVGSERALRLGDLSGSVLSEYANVTIALASARLLIFDVNNTGPAKENVVVSVRPNNLDRVGFVI